MRYAPGDFKIFLASILMPRAMHVMYILVFHVMHALVEGQYLSNACASITGETFVRN